MLKIKLFTDYTNTLQQQKTLTIVYKYAARTPLATVTGGKDESVAKTTDFKPLFLFQIITSALSHLNMALIHSLNNLISLEIIYLRRPEEE